MNKQRLPEFFYRFFNWFCPEPLQEGIMGDLEEQFEEDVMNYGLGKAKRRMAWNIVRFCRPGILRPFQKSYNLNNYGMFKNYIKIALRNIWHGKAYAFHQYFWFIRRVLLRIAHSVLYQWRTKL